MIFQHVRHVATHDEHYDDEQDDRRPPRDNQEPGKTSKSASDRYDKNQESTKKAPTTRTQPECFPPNAARIQALHVNMLNMPCAQELQEYLLKQGHEPNTVKDQCRSAQGFGFRKAQNKLDQSAGSWGLQSKV